MRCPLMAPHVWMNYNSDPNGRAEFDPRGCYGDECAWWDSGKEQCAMLTLAQKPMKARINDINMEIETAAVTMSMPAPNRRRLEEDNV